MSSRRQQSKKRQQSRRQRRQQSRRQRRQRRQQGGSAVFGTGASEYSGVANQVELTYGSAGHQTANSSGVIQLLPIQAPSQSGGKKQRGGNMLTDAIVPVALLAATLKTKKGSHK